MLLSVFLVALLPGTGAGADSGARKGRGDASKTAAAPAGLKIRKKRTQPKFSYKNAIRETIYIESDIDDDGKLGKDLLATDIIRPKTSMKVSTIYEMSPYYQNIHGSGAVQLGRGNEHEVKEEEDGDYKPNVFPLYYDNYFVPRGYAVIHQDAPGTRNSEGCMVLGGNGELAAAKATMAWLNGDKIDGEKVKAYRLDETTGLPGEEVKATWSNGKAGMIGKSYDATIANSAMSMGLKGLKTIVPVSGISRWYNYMFHNGVQFTGNSATAPLFIYYIDQPPADDEEAVGKWVTQTFGEHAACEGKGAAISGQAANASGDYTEFWDERDYMRDPEDMPSSIRYSSKMENARASIFITHGLNDFNVKPNNAFELWQLAKRNKVPAKMWLTQTGHVDPFDFRREKWVSTLHRWFDKWLYGINNGIMKEPAVDIERGPDKWTRHSTWPDKKARKLHLKFGPAKKGRIGTLKRKNAAPDATQEYTDEPAGELEMASDPKTVKANRLLFLTKKLKRNVRLSGEFLIRLSASVDQVDTNFTFLLVDYGTKMRVNHNDSGEGISTSTTKESCHGASTELDDACYFLTEKTKIASPIEIVSVGWLDAKHRRRKTTNMKPYPHLRSFENLTPDKKYSFRWKAYGEDYVFDKGHQIGVVVAGSDSTFTVPDPSQANVTVHLQKSKVVMPVVGKKGRKALKRATK